MRLIEEISVLEEMAFILNLKMCFNTEYLQIMLVSIMLSEE